jgi:aminoglycoside phosphotransferase (APT) family kinase protein
MEIAPAEVEKGLKSLYGEERVSQVTRITDGWETDVYAFDWNGEGASTKARILRLYPGDNAEAKATREFEAMRRLHPAGFPVPQVFERGGASSPFGRPYMTMERIKGVPLGMAARAVDAPRRGEMLTLFCGVFRMLHSLDPHEILPNDPLDLSNPYAFIDDELSKMDAAVNTFDLAKTSSAPKFLEWLRERRDQAACPAYSVLHGDYHPFNLLLGENGMPAVIDWPNVCVGDYRWDLAWTLLLMSSFGDPSARAIVLEEYGRIANRAVEGIEYFEAIAAIRRFFGILIAIFAGPEKMGMRPEAAEVMKQNATHLRFVGGRLTQLTGIELPEADILLSSLA